MDIERIKQIRDIAADIPEHSDVYLCFHLIKELCDALTDSTVYCECSACNCGEDNVK